MFFIGLTGIVAFAHSEWSTRRFSSPSSRRKTKGLPEVIIVWLRNALVRSCKRENNYSRQCWCN